MIADHRNRDCEEGDFQQPTLDDDPVRFIRTHMANIMWPPLNHVITYQLQS